MMKICQDIAGQGFAQKYYLSGGTALALQIEHRKSIDLDFFTAKDIDVEELIAWLDHHYSEKDAEIVFRKSDQIDFRILGTNISPGFKGLRISPDREIALMKAYVLGRRTSFRDYIDLYYLLKLSCTSIEEIIKDCSKKYVIDGEKVFSEKLFLQQLAYTEDITDKQEALSLVLERSLAAETVENFLRSQVAVYMRTLGNRDKDEGGL